ncbi:MAG: sulfatase [Planctomycetota bacterium]
MMTMINAFLRFVLVLVALGACSAAGPSASPPNVIIVLVDDLGASDLGCCGSVFYETPHIDRLAAEGMRFTSAYAASAVCSPTRASILTGRYPARVGITDWIRPLAGREWTEQEIRGRPEYVGGPKRQLLTPSNPRWMEHDEVTIAEVLRASGYATGFVGKWHLGPEPWWPESQGFDFNVGGCDYGHPPGYFDPYPATHQRGTFPNLPPRKEGEYLTDREADEAVSFIRRHADRPFFLYLCHYAVHSPLQAKPDLVEHYRGKPAPANDGQSHPPYAAMVHSVDDAMGRILEALEALGIADNTILLFTSDNGGATHFPATDNRPLRSGKGRPHEGGIRVPLIVRWPGRIGADTTSDTPVSTIDLLPTICAATGAPLPAATRIDGVSLMPLLDRSGSIDRDALFWHFPHYWWGGRLTPYSVVRRGDLKLIRWYGGGADELYDLAADLGEANDLAAEMPQKARDLGSMLDAWLAETGAKLPRPNPNYQAE